MLKVKDMDERMKAKAEIFLKNSIKAFIVDVYDNYYFCEIIFVGEDSIHVQHFTGKKKYEKERIFYPDILKFEEYEENSKRNRGVGE